VLDDIRPLRKIAAQPLKDFMVFDAAPAIDVQGILAPVGVEFAGDATYEATNRSFGRAKISFLQKPSTALKATNKAAKDTLTAKIYNDQQKLIRTLKLAKIDTGLNYLDWGLEEKGIRYPGQGSGRGGRAASAEPGGYTALPGQYKVVLYYGNAKDSTSVEIQPDPRLPYSNEIAIAKRTQLDRLNQTIEKLNQATERLDEANGIAEKVNAQLNGLDTKEAKELLKSVKAQQDSIKKIKEILFGKRLEKQGYGRLYQLTALTKINEARGALTAKPMVPNAQDINTIVQAEELTKVFVGRVNGYFTTDWAAFQKKVEETKINLFKNYTPIQ
jgi:hypothetical protein